MTAGNLPTALEARSALQALDRRSCWESGHRRDAYDTLGSATCVALGPSEKYQTPNGLTSPSNFLRVLRALRARHLRSNQLAVPACAAE
jgi:hypothetical protein